MSVLGGREKEKTKKQKGKKKERKVVKERKPLTAGVSPASILFSYSSKQSECNRELVGGSWAPKLKPLNQRGEGYRENWL